MASMSFEAPHLTYSFSTSGMKTSADLMDVTPLAKFILASSTTGASATGRDQSGDPGLF